MLDISEPLSPGAGPGMTTAVIEPDHLRPEVHAGLQWILTYIGPTTIVAINPDKGLILGRYLDHANLTEVAQWAEAQNRAGMNLYFTPNRPQPGVDRKPSKAGIVELRCVFADVDAKNGCTPEQAFASIEALPLAPTLIVMSGGGYQPFWMLDRPVPATPENIAWAEAIGKCIAERVGGDAVQNVDRILRTPFTVNWPNTTKRAAGREPALAGVVATGDGARPAYTREQIERAFPTVVSKRGAPTLSGAAPPAFAGMQLPDMNAAARSGVNDHWFDRLTTDKKNAAIRAIAEHPAFAPLADQARVEWLRPLLGFADAGRRGATEAHDIALAWCRNSTRFTGEVDFERDWRSFKPRGGVTIGTLLHAAREAGVNLEPYCASAADGGAPANDDNAAPEADGPGEESGAAFPVPRGAPFSQMPSVMTAPIAAAQLNARLCQVHDWGGSPIFARFNPDGSASPLRPADLAVLLAGHFVECPDGKGARRIPAAVWWPQSPTKSVFDRAIYDPEGARARPGEKVLNLWSGLAVRPTLGGWRLMRRHIWRVLCGQDPVAFKYLVRWLAHAVQHPGTNPETMIVLRSNAEGVGKSSVGRWLLQIFGPHGHEIADTKQAFGEFNDALANTSFVLLEEPVFPGDHKAAEMLRAVLTARTLRINPKGRPAYEVPHSVHFMMTTNGAWAIPAGAEARRFLMLDVNELMPRAYFDTLWAEANSGGIAAMLHDLLAVDLTRFNPRAVPATAALIEQQRRSADDITTWTTDAVIDGAIIPGTAGGGFGTAWSSAILHSSYLEWCKGQGVRRPKTAREFGRALGELGFQRSRSNNPPVWAVPEQATVLAAADRRAGIRRR